DYPELRPVRIRRGAFGSDVPSADLLVSPQHRVLLSGHHVPVESADAEILAAATDLVTLGLAEVEETATVTYYHMMFDQHEIVWADGCWSESFLPEAAALDGLHDAQLREILTIFPELATRAGQRAYLPARRMLSLDPREPARIAPRAACGPAGAGFTCPRATRPSPPACRGRSRRVGRARAASARSPLQARPGRRGRR